MMHVKRIISICIFLACFGYPSWAANHFFTGLPVDANGWTDIEAITSSGYASARVVFVDATGGNDGTGAVYSIGDVSFDSNGIPQMVGSLNTYQTIASAYAQMRPNTNDIMLLKRGETWAAALSGYANSGSAQSTPHIIASYGSGNRPVLSGVGLNTRDADYLLISGIKFYAADWTTETPGLDVRGNPTYQTLENLVFDQVDRLIVQGQSDEYAQYIAFRRCIWTNNEAYDGQLYAQQGNYILVEECLFHEPRNSVTPSEFGRNFYFTSEGTSGAQYKDRLNNVTFRGNIFTNADRSLHLRSGGKFENNLVIQASDLLVGGTGGSAGTIQTDNTVKDNVFVEGPINATNFDGVKLANLDGLDFSNNIFTDNTNITDPFSHNIIITGDDTSLHIAKNQTYEGNIIYGMNYASATEHYGISIDSALTDVENIIIKNNDFQMVNGAKYIIMHRTYDSGTKRFEAYTYNGNNYYSTASTSSWFVPGGDYASWVTESGETGSSTGQTTFTAPNRTIGTYNQSLGGTATTAAFKIEVLGQDQNRWDTDYMAVAANNYFRAGFDKDAVSYSYTGPSAPPTGGATSFDGVGSAGFGGEGSSAFGN